MKKLMVLVSLSLVGACAPRCPAGTSMVGEGCVRTDDVVSDLGSDVRDASAADVLTPDVSMEDVGLDAGDGRVCASSDPLDERGADENCDGVDGIASEMVFVAAAGMAGATGTATSPVQTLLDASRIAAGNARIRTVLVARGATYSAEGLEALLSNGVRVYGTFTYTRDPMPTDYPNWTRLAGDLERMPTIIDLPQRGLRVSGGMNAALGFLALRARPTTASDPTSIGAVLDGARGFVFDHATISANSGFGGVNGQNGAPTPDEAMLRVGASAMAQNGGAGGGRFACRVVVADGGVDASADGGAELSPSVGLAQSVGGRGGQGAFGSALAEMGVTGGGGAAGGQPVTAIQGTAGAPGRSGAAGAGARSSLSFDRMTSQLSLASPGRGGWGEMGQGGGGGAGGYRPGGCAAAGGGGGGGAGGCGGAPGESGTSGGHSVALVVLGELPRFVSSELRAGSGGAGGRGGEGAEGSVGGLGGLGFAPTSASCAPGGTGGAGGAGGPGGTGGGGGGGAGGWSVGLLAVGVSVAGTPSGVTITLGRRAAAGEGGRPSGTAGADGEVRETLQLP
jgi:hypothetical protein